MHFNTVKFALARCTDRLVCTDLIDCTVYKATKRIRWKIEMKMAKGWGERRG